MENPTYPGVYIRELPSGSRTIVGVATSITAFIGRARRGPVETATTIRSWGAFVSTFGGLWVQSPMSYAVYQYFQSGGTEAIIVRCIASTASAAVTTALPAGADADTSFLRLEVLDTVPTATSVSVTIAHVSTEGFTIEVTAVSEISGALSPETHTFNDVSEVEGALRSNYILARCVPRMRPEETSTAQALSASGGAVRGYSFPATAETSRGSVAFAAANEGAWANSLFLHIDHDTSDVDCGLFNLTVRETDSSDEVVAEEVFRNVSLNPDHGRFVTDVLENSSRLIAVSSITLPSGSGGWEGGAWRPDPITEAVQLTGGADGGALTGTDIMGQVGDTAEDSSGMYALLQVDLFNLLCLPPPSFTEELSTANWAEALAFCGEHRAICLVDPPSTWTISNVATEFGSAALTSENGAMYFPRVKLSDPLRENRLSTFAPCGVVAGLIAKTDATRGIWKAPAGLDARTPIVRGLDLDLSDADQGRLNPLGLNCLRTFNSVGTVVWGGRTLAGSDRLSSDWKYLPVRRLALYIEESLYRGMQWAVFEPNDEPLWAQIRLAAGTFMQRLFRQGAFKGASPKDAYMVKCDAETTPDIDVDLGIVNLQIGFAPLKPAEFVIISIKQIAGQASA